jgi:hypothetical protein
MMIRLALVLLIACSSASHPARTAAPTPVPTPAGLPAEVTKLLERWETCWHFSGEEPYDAARRKELADAVAASCPGNEEERTRLQQKWASDPAVQDALRKLDEMQ